ncbi:MAG: PilN domain-containing protein [Elusimicrobia bacterium]|nr:PilN domain-containing protein [Elusimicrobiota bacterium]
MIKVNLVPADILAKAQQKQQVFQLGVVGVGVLVVVAFISAAHFTKAVRLEAEQKQQEAEYAKWQEEVKLIENLEKQAAELRKRLTVVSDLLKGRPLYARFMMDVVKTLPGGVWVRSINTSSAGNSVKVTTSAEATSPEEIREWVRRMEGSGRFSAVEIGAVTATTALPRVFSFNMTGTYTAEL